MQLKQIGFFLLLSGSVFLFSCNKSSSYKVSENGLEYRIIVDSNQAKAKIDEIAKFHATWRNAKDSVILSTEKNNTPQFGVVYKAKYKGDPIELLTMMGPGDSASCKVPVDSMFKGFPLPKFLKHGDVITLDMKMLEVLTKEQYDQQMQAKAMEQAGAEDKQIEAYIAANNLKAEKKPSGLYVVVENPGNGKQAENGKTVQVDYTGKRLDGFIFDSSSGKAPLEFVVRGQPPMIEGMEEGVTYFKEGGKGKLIVPSKLGYGERGNGPNIPPNSVLVFDIGVVGVK